MNKESKLNLNAGDYAIRHCVIDQTYDGIEVHKMLCDAYIAGNNDTLDDEDEKIRKVLLNDFKNNCSEYYCEGVNRDMIIAWLEKQGEHANFRNKIQVGDKVTRNEAGMLVNLSQLKRVAKPSEKQGGQKLEMKTAEESLGIDSDTYNKIVDECIFGEQKPKENKGNIGGISPNWSEEDEQHVNSLLKRLDSLCRIKFERTRFAISEDRDWLKSLRPQNRWKPSDEQMSLLQAIINEPNNAASESCQIVLREVLEQLKKLKEE